MTALAPGEVVGREAELERLGGFLDPGRGELALLLEGVAGIGKTTLWRAGIELGREQRYRVLWCRPTASETAFSFAALGDLLSPVIEDLLPRLPRSPASGDRGRARARRGRPGELQTSASSVWPCCVRWACSRFATRCWWRSTTCSGWIRLCGRACDSLPEGSKTSASSCCFSVRVEPGSGSAAARARPGRSSAAGPCRPPVQQRPASDHRGWFRPAVAAPDAASPPPRCRRQSLLCAGDHSLPPRASRAAASPADPLPVPPTMEELLPRADHAAAEGGQRRAGG